MPAIYLHITFNNLASLLKFNMHRSSNTILTGSLFILFGLITLAAFQLLIMNFEYPDILRKGIGYTLTKYNEGGASLQLLWYGMTFGSLCMIIAAPLLHVYLKERNIVQATTIATFAFSAGLFNTLGFIRWVFMLPALAQTYNNSKTSQTTKEAIEVVFNAFHLYAGFSIGEHLGFLFLGLFGIVFSIVILKHKLFGAWLAWLGIIGASGTLIGMLEGAGLQQAAIAAQIGSTLQILWVILVGVMMLRPQHSAPQKR